MALPSPTHRRCRVPRPAPMPHPRPCGAPHTQVQVAPGPREMMVNGIEMDCLVPFRRFRRCAWVGAASCVFFPTVTRDCTVTS
jgi:hypothetical protein